MSDAPRLDRRTTLRWMLAAAASAPLGAAAMLRTSGATPEGGARRTGAGALGYGTDPDLVTGYSPGTLWPLTLDGVQRRCATVLCDLIIPADEHGPAASAVGVPDFIDEWVSAPYEQQQSCLLYTSPSPRDS